MDFKKVWIKAFQGLLTVVVSFLVANNVGIVDFVTGFLPESLNPEMTIAGVVGALIVGITNYLKHLNK